MNFLVLLAIVLLIIAGHQLLRIIELSRGLKKAKEWQITDNDNNMMGKAMLLFMIVFFVFFFWQVNRWMDRSLPPAASVHGEKIDASLKSDVEAAIAATRTAIEGGDTAEITAKAQALTEVAMKMGQAIYEKEQPGAASPGAEAPTGDDDVVDAEFSEVDENKG